MAQADTLDTNLLATGKKAKLPAAASPEPKPMQPARKRALKILAYVLIFLFSLVLFLLMKIPSSLVTNTALQYINAASPLEVQAQSLNFSLLLLPHLNAEKLELSPRFPDTGNPILIDKAKLYPGIKTIFLAASGKPGFAGSFDLDAYKANANGSFSAGADTSLDLELTGLDLGKFAPLTEAGIQLQGLVQSLTLDIVMNANRLSQADGEIQLRGKNFVIDPAQFQLPMALPILDFGPVEILGKLQKGKLRLDKAQLGEAAKDMELKAEGEIILKEPLTFSQVDLKLRLKPSEKIKKAIPTLEGMLGMVGAKRADGFYGMKIKGVLSQPMLPTPDAGN